MISKAAYTILLIGVISIAEGRPQLFDFLGTTVEGGVDLMGILTMTGEGASGIVTGTVDTFKSFGDGIHVFIGDAFQEGAEATQELALAIQDSAGDVADGITNTVDASRVYLADGLRSGGRLASKIIQVGFNLTKDTMGDARDFAEHMRGSVRRGFDDAAGAISEFSTDVMDHQLNLIGAASGVLENVALTGTEEFHNVLVPSV